ncbi:DUF3592 domain-containing protein [Streptomyces globisporus]|uniref:DUF3592 domain-containing protein n=1 Tax=Streptomyces globisporus TaxID=1908 RepID=UPI0037FCC4AA
MIEVLFYVPFYLVYIYLIGEGIREILIHRRLEREGVCATGTVTSIHHTVGRESVTTQEIEFRDAYGRRRQFTSRPGISCPAVGFPVKVHYLLEKPKVVRVVGRGIVGAYWKIAFGVVMAGLFIWSSATRN